MTIYVLYRKWDYEGNEDIGLFSTLQKAMDYGEKIFYKHISADSWTVQDNGWRSRWDYDDYRIDAVALDPET